MDHQSLLPFRDSKRKAESLPYRSTKKIRQSSAHRDPPTSESELSDSGSTIGSDGDHSTPRTPATPKQYPSLLKIIQCTYIDCEKTFNRPARLAEHLRSHTNTRLFVCPQTKCNKDFLRATHLNHHLKSAHTDSRDYVCSYDDCGKSFVTSTRLKRHYAAHEGREKYKCHEAECGLSFRKHSTLQRHQTTDHDGRPAFVCDEANCGAGFKTAGKLKAHRGRIHGSSRYWCLICKENSDNGDAGDLAFSTYSSFQAHNKDSHPPTCGKCNLPCNSNRELKRHIESQHGTGDGLPPMQQREEHLLERQIHTCLEPDCGKGFAKRGNMLVHLKTVHGGEKPFSCGRIDVEDLNNVQGWDLEKNRPCGRSFSAKASLEEHIRTAHIGLDNSRKGKRKPQKKSATKVKKEKVKPSTLDLLTGTTGDSATESMLHGREIACALSGCQFHFASTHDRDIHMHSHHGVYPRLNMNAVDLYDDRENYDIAYNNFDQPINNELDDYDMDHGDNEADEDEDEMEHEVDGKEATDFDWTASLENAAAAGVGDFWLGGTGRGPSYGLEFGPGPGHVAGLRFAENACTNDNTGGKPLNKAAAEAIAMKRGNSTTNSVSFENSMQEDQWDVDEAEMRRLIGGAGADDDDDYENTHDGYEAEVEAGAGIEKRKRNHGEEGEGGERNSSVVIDPDL